MQKPRKATAKVQDKWTQRQQKEKARQKYKVPEINSLIQLSEKGPKHSSQKSDNKASMIHLKSRFKNTVGSSTEGKQAE